MNTLLRQYRELGIGTIVVDQHAHLLSSAALGNSVATICLNQKDPADVGKAAALTGLSENEKRWLSRLPVGQAVVRLQDRYHEPFLVKFPLIEIDKGAVDDATLQAYIRQSDADSPRNPPNGRVFEQIRQIPTDDDPLSDVEMTFIEDVLDHPDDGVKSRYERLRLSGSRGNTYKLLLLRRGWLESQVVPVGNSRKLLLRLTASARQALGLEQSSGRRESLAHEYWKRFHARRLAAEGYSVSLEVKRRNGWVDVLATRNGLRVAVEIETGRSNAVENVRNDLRSGFEKIVVVATNEAALAKLEREFAIAGLIIPGRVELVLRDRSTPLQA